ncbi:MAG: hypothetical protein DMG23_04120 [Acidobacteria bacterium]|nr:MAG: hypothetical protein DMG23_04120 [Acidobacteriota bacterium]
MGKVLSIDLAYRRAADFGVCTIMEREGRAVRVRFLSASELGIADPPDGVQCGRAIRDFCRNESIPLVLIDGPQGWKSRTSTLKHARVCECPD